MASKQMVHMNQGHGETSYARNSGIQKAEQDRMKPLIEAAITELCNSSNTLKHMVIADLGCSSGANALALVSFVVEAIHSHYLQFQQTHPEVSIILNDLPDNDFNTVIKGLVTLQRSYEPIVVTGVAPGSFYERLFTSGSLHLVCSSTSLHWLSKAPEELTRSRIPAYDIDEHARCARLPMVLEAYAKQFRNDFTRFLEMRAKELVPGGRMVISLLGRHSEEISTFSRLSEFLHQILSVVASKGVFEKEKFDSFYVPMYEPSSKELQEIIEDEGSFFIREMRVHDPMRSVDSGLITPSRFAIQMRAIFEPIIVQHFGEVMDELMQTMERRWSLEGSLNDEIARSAVAMVAISLTRRHDC